MTEVDKFYALVPLWIAVGIASGILFYKGSYEVKRKWAPRFIVCSSLLFLGFIYWVFGAGKNLVFPALAVALITIINIRTLSFCPKCAAFQKPVGLFTKAQYCAKCGHEIEKPSSHV
jgi:hypothetical protein